MKTAVETIEGLRYKLRMFGIPVEGPANIYCDNEAVTKNTQIPESTLKRNIILLLIIDVVRPWPQVQLGLQSTVQTKI